MERQRIGGPIRTLVADEERVFVESVTALLSSHAGIEVVAYARTGDEAVACAHAYRPDVVLMNIAIPGIGGIKATQDVKRAVPSAAVLVVTAAATLEAVERATAAGADGYLTKDAACSELVAVMVELTFARSRAECGDAPARRGADQRI